LTELFFESAEPGFDQLPLAEFLKRFPEGEYQFVGLTLNGDTLSSTAILTHALPDAPVLLSPAENSVQDPNHTVIRWEPVADPICEQKHQIPLTQDLLLGFEEVDPTPSQATPGQGLSVGKCR